MALAVGPLDHIYAKAFKCNNNKPLIKATSLHLVAIKDPKYDNDANVTLWMSQSYIYTLCAIALNDND